MTGRDARCFPLDRYDRTLYRAHVEAIYKGLLVHLDDPASDIQVNRASRESRKLHDLRRVGSRSPSPEGVGAPLAREVERAARSRSSQASDG